MKKYLILAIVCGTAHSAQASVANSEGVNSVVSESTSISPANTARFDRARLAKGGAAGVVTVSVIKSLNYLGVLSMNNYLMAFMSGVACLATIAMTSNEVEASSPAHFQRSRTRSANVVTPARSTVVAVDDASPTQKIEMLSLEEVLHQVTHKTGFFSTSANLRADKDALSVAYSKVLCTLEMLYARKETHKKESERLAGECGTLMAQLAEMKQSFEDIKTVNTRLERDNAVLLERLSGLEKLKKESDDLRRQSAALQSKSTELQVANATLKALRQDGQSNCDVRSQARSNASRASVALAASVFVDGKVLGGDEAQFLRETLAAYREKIRKEKEAESKRQADVQRDAQGALDDVF